jgi:hypothetical protein
MITGSISNHIVTQFKKKINHTKKELPQSGSSLLIHGLQDLILKNKKQVKYQV